MFPTASTKRIHVNQLNYIQRFYQFKINVNNDKISNNETDIKTQMHERVQLYISRTFSENAKPLLNVVTYQPKTEMVTVLLQFSHCPFGNNESTRNTDFSQCVMTEDKNHGVNNGSYAKDNSINGIVKEVPDNPVSAMTYDNQNLENNFKLYRNHNEGTEKMQHFSKNGTCANRGTEINPLCSEANTELPNWVRHFLSFQEINEIMDQSVKPFFTELSG
ncbi:hypothetical protein RFI_08271 [Reticulomyxa filosa]|uniref:Uncharacterized protein n=1 Tax=Reticulomyxa filosa TaxID=46433 RepID=X6NUB9_RETFI|nr:hypothetical protein RFI_08271 [Reticulomyxa filosa]|eukprot:ETO28857.1 hypothetical protein RFI_08271 [Reticulomyxa filosa]